MIRRRRRRLPERSSLEFNLTSMIDVVFQLLIYFIVGTTFAMDEESYRMDLPDREVDAGAAALSLEDEPILIRVYPEGQILVPGPWNGPRSVRTLGEFLDHQRRAGQPTRFRNLSTGATAKYEQFLPPRLKSASVTRSLKSTAGCSVQIDSPFSTSIA